MSSGPVHRGSSGSSLKATQEEDNNFAKMPSEKKNTLNKDFKRSPNMEAFIEFNDWFTNELGPGPSFLPMRYYINL